MQHDLDLLEPEDHEIVYVLIEIRRHLMTLQDLHKNVQGLLRFADRQGNACILYEIVAEFERGGNEHAKHLMGLLVCVFEVLRYAAEQLLNVVISY